MNTWELQLLEALDSYAVQRDGNGIQSHCLICGADSKLNAKTKLMILQHEPACLLYELVDIKEASPDKVALEIARLRCEAEDMLHGESSQDDAPAPGESAEQFTLNDGAQFLRELNACDGFASKLLLLRQLLEKYAATLKKS